MQADGLKSNRQSNTNTGPPQLPNENPESNHNCSILLKKDILGDRTIIKVLLPRRGLIGVYLLEKGKGYRNERDTKKKN